MKDGALGLRLMIELVHGEFIGVLNRFITVKNRIDIYLEQVSNK